ncbi:MAG: peptidylprolyl isomerase [Bacteroidota bacterium]
MSKAKSGDTVRVHYTGTLDDGTQFDSSAGREPLEFTLGAGSVIPGFDKAVTGLETGESTTVRIPANEAYGERRDDLTVEIPRAQVPDHIPLELGIQLQVGTNDGGAMAMTIADVSETTVTLDGNHQLAGEALTFELELVEIV